ncbi:MAG TPA: hypothetical protein VLC09_07585 [Polyangiaceae bacterium]|nr:hypothetical protein [Polyangiaceae bacterium]
MRALTALLPLLAFALASGCDNRERYPNLDDPGDGGGASGDFGDSIDDGGCTPPPTVVSACGSETVPVLQQKPNLYFLVDVSGSMEDTIPPGSRTKMEAAKASLRSVVGELGHRMNYGLSVYPGPDGDALYIGCGTGVEVFETRAGDPITCVGEPAKGDVYAAFSKVVAGLDAEGGTPLAASLASLAPTLQALEGPTALVLLTDGAPNCNADTVCAVEDCVLNIVGYEWNGGACVPDDAEFNCCDPANGMFDGMSYCITREESIAEVSKLADAGIPTYVIGVPGVEAYADVMNSLAEAGGTARSGSIGYYDASDTDELTEALRTIGAAVTQSCDIELQTQPADVGRFNVYFDASPVARDDTDGWSLDGNIVTLHGQACEQLTSGGVNEIQMISGCITYVN